MQSRHKLCTNFFGRFSLVLLTTIFLIVMTLGVLFGMGMAEDGQMVGCPMMGDADVVCSMDVTAHLQMWGHITVSIIQKLAPLLLLSTLIFFVCLNTSITVAGLLHWFKIRRTNIPIWLLHDPLKKALSSGILHPKIFPAHA
jgi:hypothetical protein